MPGLYFGDKKKIISKIIKFTPLLTLIRSLVNIKLPIGSARAQSPAAALHGPSISLFTG